MSNKLKWEWWYEPYQQFALYGDYTFYIDCWSDFDLWIRVKGDHEDIELGTCASWEEAKEVAEKWLEEHYNDNNEDQTRLDETTGEINQ